VRLEQELAAFRAEFERTAPSGRAELYSAKVEELRRQFPLNDTLAVGDEAPDFTLPNTRRRQVSLTSVLRAGPAIVTFYRGGWCPYCNSQLRAYQRALPEIAEFGGQILAISPQLPDGSLSASEKNALEFEVLASRSLMSMSTTVVACRPRTLSPCYVRCRPRLLSSSNVDALIAAVGTKRIVGPGGRRV
jgi:thiol-disulfide isomerase/thioredoxin